MEKGADLLMTTKPLCFGQYKDAAPSCGGCGVAQECAEELFMRIREGRFEWHSARPSAVIEIKDEEQNAV